MASAAASTMAFAIVVLDEHAQSARRPRVPGGNEPGFAEQRLLVRRLRVGVLERDRQGAGVDQRVGKRFGAAVVRRQRQFDQHRASAALACRQPLL